jgi:hypothetical protein
MASTYLTRSVSSTGNRKKWTWSGWLKRTALGAKYIMSSNNGSNQYSMLQFDSTNVLRYYDYTSDYQTQLKTTRVFRDINAWYHIVFAYDSAQSTAADRVKVYVNGTQETSFGTSNYPSQDYDSFMNLSGVPHYIGRETGTSNLYDGVMSHVHFTDGYAYAASDFGSTDATTGEWKINTSPSVSYGTNGYFMFKDDNSVNDDSGNGNNFAVSAGTLTKTEDNPSNVFATFNSLNPTNPDFSNGNNTLTRSSNSWKPAWTTIGASSGKYYCEMDWDSGSNFTVGFSTADVPGSNPTLDDIVGNPSNGGYLTVLYENGVIYNNGSSAGAYGSGSSYATGDIMMLAMDLDNNKFYFGKNGTWFNSADPANNTGGYAINASYTNSTWCFTACVYGTGSWHGNFGNGYFGTTAVSSAGTNASNIGIFEYNVPTGYTALSTKGLNE